MKVGTDNSKYRIMAEINMIPFIDIALVLLIIFMVMTPFLVRSQIKVNLPAAGQSENTSDDKETVTVQVDKVGGIFIDAKRIDPKDLVATLRQRLHNPQTQPLSIEADKDVAFQHIVVVLDAGREIGAARLGVCVKPVHGQSAGSR